MFHAGHGKDIYVLAAPRTEQGSRMFLSLDTLAKAIALP